MLIYSVLIVVISLSRKRNYHNLLLKNKCKLIEELPCFVT